MCETRKEYSEELIQKNESFLISDPVHDDEALLASETTLSVEVPLTGLSIIYNGERWFTLDSMAVHEGLTRRGVEQRCARGYYESVRTCGILIWRKKQGV